MNELFPCYICNKEFPAEQLRTMVFIAGGLKHPIEDDQSVCEECYKKKIF